MGVRVTVPDLDRDPTVEAIGGLDSSAGVVVQTGADAFTKRSIAVSGSNISVANGSGASGNPTISLASVLQNTTASFTTADETKLDGIEALADVTADAVPEIWVKDRTGATAQAKINDADDNGTAGLALILEKTAAPTAQPDALSSGRSVIGSPGGSTYTPVSSSAFSGLRAIGTVSALTLDGNSAAQDDFLTLTTVSGRAVGDIITIGVTISSEFYSITTRVRDIVSPKVYLDDKLPFAVTTTNITELNVWSGAYSGAKFSDMAWSGASLTGSTAIGIEGQYLHRCEFDNIRGEFMRTNSPALVGQNGSVVTIFAALDCRFGRFSSYRSGNKELGCFNFSRLSGCTIEEVVSEFDHNGPILQYGSNNTIKRWISTGNVGRALKIQNEKNFRIESAAARNSGYTGLICLNSSGSVGDLKLTRYRELPAILSIVVSSNVATITLDRPHFMVATTNSVTIAGCSDANLNATFAVASITGDPLTSTVFTVAVVTSDGTKGGTPTLSEPDSQLLCCTGGNNITFDNVEIEGAGATDTTDFLINSTDYIRIKTLKVDAAPTIGGSGTLGTNIIIEKLYVNGVLTAHAANPNLTEYARFTAADKILYGGTSGAPTETNITSAARSLLADASVPRLGTTNTFTAAQTLSTGGGANSTDLTVGNSQSIMKISGGDGSYCFIDSASWGVAIRTQNTNRITVTNAGVIGFASPIGLSAYTVGTLPAGVTGQETYATDLRVFNGAGTQEGGGSGTGGAVQYNGSAWKIAGTNVTAVA